MCSWERCTLHGVQTRMRCNILWCVVWPQLLVHFHHQREGSAGCGTCIWGVGSSNVCEASVHMHASIVRGQVIAGSGRRTEADNTACCVIAVSQSSPVCLCTQTCCIYFGALHCTVGAFMCTLGGVEGQGGVGCFCTVGSEVGRVVAETKQL
jgi:hypothetical protein